MAVVDLGFGDSGKGTIVDYLTRKHAAHTVIRFNGGAQAAHNVVTPDGRHHSFAQFGSGTFSPGVRTYLSRFMLIEPYAMVNENAHLQQLGVTDAFNRLLVDRAALVISPFQSAANRLRELARGADRHGSCGLGIGETVADSLAGSTLVIRAGDLPDRSRVIRKLRHLRDAKMSELQSILPAIRLLAAAQDDLSLFEAPDLIDIVADNYGYIAGLFGLADDSAFRTLMSRPGTVIFEGAQGVLLDEWYGFAPYTTWSTTTFANVETLVRESAYSGPLTRLGVLRAYHTRHGAGPFVTEDETLQAMLPEAHNATGRWQQQFRVGHFDCVATRYALNVAGNVDKLALTHLDRVPVSDPWGICNSYFYPEAENEGNSLDAFFEHSGQEISAIKVCPQVDLQHQAELSRHLFRCQPRLQSITPSNGGRGTAPEFLDRLERILGVSIAIASDGPTSLDKKLR